MTNPGHDKPWTWQTLDGQTMYTTNLGHDKSWTVSTENVFVFLAELRVSK
jgi:hypothetical protein